MSKLKGYTTDALGTVNLGVFYRPTFYNLSSTENESGSEKNTKIDENRYGRANFIVGLPLSPTLDVGGRLVVSTYSYQYTSDISLTTTSGTTTSEDRNESTSYTVGFVAGAILGDNPELELGGTGYFNIGGADEKSNWSMTQQDFSTKRQGNLTSFGFGPHIKYLLDERTTVRTYGDLAFINNSYDFDKDADRTASYFWWRAGLGGGLEYEVAEVTTLVAGVKVDNLTGWIYQEERKNSWEFKREGDEQEFSVGGGIEQRLLERVFLRGGLRLGVEVSNRSEILEGVNGTKTLDEKEEGINSFTSPRLGLGYVLTENIQVDLLLQWNNSLNIDSDSQKETNKLSGTSEEKGNNDFDFGLSVSINF